MGTSTATLAAERFDTEVLGRHWIPLSMTDSDTAAVLRERLGVDFSAAGERDRETDDFLYLPVVVNYRRGDGALARETIVFALNEDFLVTWQPAEPFAPFDAAIAKLGRDPLLTGSSHGVMYALLWALNDSSRRILSSVDDTLTGVRRDLATATSTALRSALTSMDDAEEIVGPVRETQRYLAGAARQLRAGIAGRRELDTRAAALVADVDSVEKYAAAEYDTLRYLQHSVRSRLDIERNRIIEILTLIAAVCLPPTLISTFANVIGMPEWEFGFLATTFVTVAAAVIPFVYVVRKGLQR
ncbi:CorA family divalent cation transporter [Nocardia sp. NPDC005366]|uniref:CorA family divalent cation transporter n=1 Tax=Nocardia sp. NPDC005366 TaxID=3156878 RepID=UPI0033A90160